MSKPWGRREGAHFLWPLSRRGLNPIKRTYTIRQYSGGPVTGTTSTQNSPFLPSGAETIASTRWPEWWTSWVSLKNTRINDRPATAYTLERILRKIPQKTSFWVRKCLLGVTMTIFNIYFLTFPKERHFGDRSSTKTSNIYRKRHSVAEIQLSYRKSRSPERMAGSQFWPEASK